MILLTETPDSQAMSAVKLTSGSGRSQYYRDLERV